MAEMMVGRQVSFKVEKSAREPGDVILSLRNLRIPCRRKGDPILIDALDIRAGEIVGVAGVEGNGQTELIEALTGLRRIESGSMVLSGKDITNASIRTRKESGLAHIPEDRQKRGLVLDYTLEENFILKNHREAPYSHGDFLDAQAISDHADRVIEAFDVRSGEGGNSKARDMSGGNQQKAIIGREFDQNPDLLIAVQPTRGLDVGSIEYIHKRLVEQRDSGKAVLLVSLELEEILDLSDRIAVINHGRIVGIVDAAATNEKEIGLMMAGVGKEQAA